MTYPHSRGLKAALTNYLTGHLFIILALGTSLFTTNTAAAPHIKPSSDYVNKLLSLTAHTKSSSNSLQPPALRYHGGPVLSSIQVNPIFYGGVNVSYFGELETFYTVVTNSSYVDWRKNDHTFLTFILILPF